MFFYFTAPMQSDQGLHYLPTPSTLFVLRQDVQILGNLYRRVIHYYFNFLVFVYFFMIFFNMGKQVFLPNI